MWKKVSYLIGLTQMRRPGIDKDKGHSQKDEDGFGKKLGAVLHLHEFWNKKLD